MSKMYRARVLVVDDNVERQARVAEALVEAGFETAMAGTGERALLILRQWPRQVGWLVTRTELPGLVDGRMLADEFHQTFASRPVVYITSQKPPRASSANEIVLDDPVSPVAVVETLQGLDPNIATKTTAITAWAA